MSDKKIGNFFVQEPGIGGKPADWDEVMITPLGHPMLRDDLDKHTEEDIEIFRRTMATLQENTGVPVGGYPKGQMAVVVVGNAPKRIPTLADMNRLLLLQSESKTNGPQVIERLKERPSIITEKMMSTLENPNGRHAMLVAGRTLGKNQIVKAWLDYIERCQSPDESAKDHIRAALRAKTKKGPKRKTYPL